MEKNLFVSLILCVVGTLNASLDQEQTRVIEIEREDFFREIIVTQKTGKYSSNKLAKCEHVPGISGGKYADQLIFWFDLPFCSVIEAQEKGYFVLSFSGFGSKDFEAAGVQKKLSALQGVTSVTMVQWQDPVLAVVIGVSYDPELVELRFHSPPGSAYLKIDAFSPGQLEKYAHDSLAPTKPIIVIDPGHGGDDWGALGVGGVKEKDINLAVACKLYQELKAAGYEVYLIRDQDTFTSIEKKLELMHQLKGTLFVCIHANYSPWEETRGVELFPRVKDTHATDFYLAHNAATMKKLFNEMSDRQLDNSLQAAQEIQKAMSNVLKNAPPIFEGQKLRSNVSIEWKPLRTLLLSEVPAVLVELGYITNFADALLLVRPDYQELLVVGIKNGLERYLSE